MPIACARKIGELGTAVANSRRRRRAKGNDGLSREVVAGRKSGHRPRWSLPPNREADVHGVVVCKIDRSVYRKRIVNQAWVVVFGAYAARLVAPIQVFFAVRLCGLYDKYVRPNGIGDDLGNCFCMALCRVVCNERFAVAGGGVGLRRRGR